MTDKTLRKLMFGRTFKLGGDLNNKIATFNYDGKQFNFRIDDGILQTLLAEIAELRTEVRKSNKK